MHSHFFCDFFWACQDKCKLVQASTENRIKIAIFRGKLHFPSRTVFFFSTANGTFFSSPHFTHTETHRHTDTHPHPHTHIQFLTHKFLPQQFIYFVCASVCACSASVGIPCAISDEAFACGLTWCLCSLYSVCIASLNTWHTAYICKGGCFKNGHSVQCAALAYRHKWQGVRNRSPSRQQNH